MVDQSNSIKEILKMTKEMLSKDSELMNEKNDFESKVSRATEGNVLVLNKIFDQNTTEDLDQRTKKITEIVQHQNALLLNKEVLTDDDVLVLDQEAKKESPPLVLDQEFDDDYVSDEIHEIHDELDELKARVEEKDPFIERIESLENQQKITIDKINQTIEEMRSKDPSEEIALKFDILSNQLSNEIDEKIDGVKSEIEGIKNEISVLDQNREHLSQDLKEHKDVIENRLELLQQSNESLKSQITQMNSQFDEFKQSFETKLNSQISNEISRIENKINENLNNIKNIIEQDKAQRALEEENKKKAEEEAKNNDPEYQANQRMNSIYKLLEMQMSQSLINSTSAQRGQERKVYKEERDPSAYTNSIVADIENSEVFMELNNKLGSLNKLAHTLSDLVEAFKVVINNNQSSSSIDLDKIESMFQHIQSSSVSESKLNEMIEMLRSIKNDNQQQDQLSSLIAYFKSNELKNLDQIQTDLSEMKQFTDPNVAKDFIEKTILNETQNWIKNNQKNIEEICKKIIYK